MQAEVWNVDVAAKSSEFTDVQLSTADVRPGRKVIAEHLKVIDVCQFDSVYSEMLPVII